ncbi:MAG: HAD family hydrolase [DPANN group archaeon]|nr:HAD family hydrolase [DPANN group archaeon]
MPRAIFLDRDGTLNEETMYAHRIEDFRLLPGVIEGLQKLRDAGYLFFIITNQSGIGRGIFSEKEMHRFNDHLLSVLKQEGIRIEKVYFCPHHPEEGCDCRKPSPRYVFEAAKDFSIDLAGSYMFGDHRSDMLLARNAGIRSVFLLTGHGKEEFDRFGKEMSVDFVAKDLGEATGWVLDDNKRS